MELSRAFRRYNRSVAAASRLAVVAFVLAFLAPPTAPATAAPVGAAGHGAHPHLTVGAPQATTVASYDISGYELTGVACATQELCFAVGFADSVTPSSSPGTASLRTTTSTPIFESTNAGESWWRLDGTPYRDVFGLIGTTCPTTTECFAYGGWGGSGGEPDLYRWSASTGTWADLSAGLESATGGPVTSAVYALSCPSSSTCVAVGFDPSVPTAPAGAWAAISTDAGQTWTVTSGGLAATCAPSNCVAGLTDVDCPTTSVCVASGFGESIDTTTGAPAYGAAIVRSSDGGASWSELFNTAVPIKSPPAWNPSCQPSSTVSCNASGLNAITCEPANPANCDAAGGGTPYVANLGPDLFQTSDGGAIWTQAAGGEWSSGDGDSFYAITCAPQAAGLGCVATGRTVASPSTHQDVIAEIATTTTVDYVTPSDTTNPGYWAVACPQTTSCIAVGGWAQTSTTSANAAEPAADIWTLPLGASSTPTFAALPVTPGQGRSTHVAAGTSAQSGLACMAQTACLSVPEVSESATGSPDTAGIFTVDSVTATAGAWSTQTSDVAVTGLSGGDSWTPSIGCVAGTKTCVLAALTAMGAAPTVFETTDGGGTWAAIGTASVLMAGPAEIPCTQSGLCYLPATYVKGGSAAVEVIDTATQRMATSAPWPSSVAPPAPGYSYGDACLASGVCLFPAVESTSSASSVVVEESADGGATWATEETGVDFGATSTITSIAFACAAPTTCYGLANAVDGSSLVAQVFMTTDAGSDWSTIGQATPSAQAGVAGEAVACASPEVCVVLPGASPSSTDTVFATADGAQTWVPGSTTPQAGTSEVSWATAICPAATSCLVGLDAVGNQTSAMNAYSTDEIDAVSLPAASPAAVCAPGSLPYTEDPTVGPASISPQGLTYDGTPVQGMPASGTADTPQSATPGTSFAQGLSDEVFCTDGSAPRTSGESVDYAPPPSSPTATVTTPVDLVAPSAPTSGNWADAVSQAAAGAQAGGPYAVVARLATMPVDALTFVGYTTPQESYALTNASAQPSCPNGESEHLGYVDGNAALSGAGQVTSTGTVFAHPLYVQLTCVTSAGAVAGALDGAQVIWATPPKRDGYWTQPLGPYTGTRLIDGVTYDGVSAPVTVTAGDLAGAWNMVASAPVAGGGDLSTQLPLDNAGTCATGDTIVVATEGSGQTAASGQTFDSPLGAGLACAPSGSLTDPSTWTPLDGAEVTWTVPTPDPTATFPNGLGSASAVTGSSSGPANFGWATSPPMTAGSCPQAETSCVFATVAPTAITLSGGTTIPLSYVETISSTAAPCPGGYLLEAGPGDQSAQAGGAFPLDLAGVAACAQGPATAGISSGLVVTFTNPAPGASQPSATFSLGQAHAPWIEGPDSGSATSAFGAQGIGATASTMTASAVPGIFTDAVSFGAGSTSLGAVAVADLAVVAPSPPTLVPTTTTVTCAPDPAGATSPPSPSLPQPVTAGLGEPVVCSGTVVPAVTSQVVSAGTVTLSAAGFALPPVAVRNGTYVAPPTSALRIGTNTVDAQYSGAAFGPGEAWGPSRASTPVVVTETCVDPRIVASTGAGQRAEVGHRFAEPLTVQVACSFGSASGLAVAWEAAGSTEASGSADPASGVTGPDGTARTSVVANMVAGPWVMEATVTGASGQPREMQAAFTLDNSAPPPLSCATPSLALVSGGGQSARIGSPFAQGITVEALCGGKPAAGAAVVFVLPPPTSGSSAAGVPSATFAPPASASEAGPIFTATSGAASSPGFGADMTPGTWTGMAAWVDPANGDALVTSPVPFTERNTTSSGCTESGYSLGYLSGSNQQALVTQPFGAPLVVSVTPCGTGRLPSSVTFADCTLDTSNPVATISCAPAGPATPGGTFGPVEPARHSPYSAPIQAAKAQAFAMADATAGRWVAEAATPDGQSVGFAMMNTDVTCVLALDASAGSDQSASAGRSFAKGLAATLRCGGQAIDDVTVSFAVTDGDAIVSWGAGGTATTAVTNTAGVATTSPPTAGAILGAVAVTATATFGGQRSSATYALAVTVDPTTTVASADPAQTAVGTSVTITADVTSFGSPVTQGSVTFVSGGAVIATVAVVDGVARTTTATLAPGGHTIDAIYNPAGDFGASQGSTAVVITASPPPPPERGCKGSGCGPTVITPPVGGTCVTRRCPSSQPGPIAIPITTTKGGHMTHSRCAGSTAAAETFTKMIVRLLHNPWWDLFWILLLLALAALGWAVWHYRRENRRLRSPETVAAGMARIEARYDDGI